MISTESSETKDGPQGRLAVDVAVTDTEHPRLAPTFTYAYAPGLSELIRLIGVQLRVVQKVVDDRGPGSEGQITAVELRRRVPWGSWDRAARSAATAWFAERRPGGSGPAVASGDEKLERVAEEYRANLRSGVRDPAAAIAREHGVSPQTARYWLMRARRLGVLGPAGGPTPGEAGPPLPPGDRAGGGGVERGTKGRTRSGVGSGGCTGSG